jgi:hypothetical protein
MSRIIHEDQRDLGPYQPLRKEDLEGYKRMVDGMWEAFKEGLVEYNDCMELQQEYDEALKRSSN